MEGDERARLVAEKIDERLDPRAHPEAHRASMRLTAEYLVEDPGAARDQMDWTPEFSRRARGFVVYAALRSLGRQGVAELVERSCARARQFARSPICRGAR